MCLYTLNKFKYASYIINETIIEFNIINLFSFEKILFDSHNKMFAINVDSDIIIKSIIILIYN